MNRTAIASSAILLSCLAPPRDATASHPARAGHDGAVAAAAGDSRDVIASRRSQDREQPNPPDCTESRPKPSGPTPPPAQVWDVAAFRRAQAGVVPFAWTQEWLDSATRFCGEPESRAEVSAIARWDITRLASLVEWLDWLAESSRCSGEKPTWYETRAVRAAALLHTVTFFHQAVSENDGPALSAHLKIAGRLLRERQWDAPLDHDLRRAWVMVTARWLAARSLWDDAIDVVESELTTAPRDPGLHVVLGTLYEGMASPLREPEAPNDFARAERAKAVASALDHAKLAFRKAVEMQPLTTTARLHLGRVLQRQGLGSDALREYEEVLRSSAVPEERWLAYLWRGRIHEEAGRLIDAMESYRSASDILPSSTVTIAIAHAMDLMGDRVGAQTELRHFEGDGLACQDACDPYQSYDLIDRTEVADSVRSLVARLCGSIR